MADLTVTVVVGETARKITVPDNLLSGYSSDLDQTLADAKVAEAFVAAYRAEVYRRGGRRDAA